MKNTTSDGIAMEDWHSVREICQKILSAVEAEDELLEEAHKTQLHTYLDDLQRKYGEIPSLLATRADYVDDEIAKGRLLKKAFQIAKIKNDSRNLTLISSSLAQLFVEDVGDPIEGKKWLSELERCLKFNWDSGEQEEYYRLSKLVALL